MMLIEKQKSHAFGKDVYLLGVDKDGTKYWLEEPTWDCGWYWGCGYVETYHRNASPSWARDIDSHQHFKGMFLEKNEKGLIYKDAWEDLFIKSPLTDKEIWTLLELFKTIYAIKEMADITGRGGSHITTNPCKELITSEIQTKDINDRILPALFNEVKKLLTDSAEEV